MNGFSFPLGCFYSPREEKEWANKVEKLRRTAFLAWGRQCSSHLCLVPLETPFSSYLGTRTWGCSSCAAPFLSLSLRFISGDRLELCQTRSLTHESVKLVTPLRVTGPVPKSLGAMACRGTTGENVSWVVVFICLGCSERVAQFGWLTQ